MNEIPKAVFTRTGYAGYKVSDKKLPTEATWAEARIFDGDLAEEIKRLKSEPGKPIVAIGGGGFMQSLIATGLVDEYVLAVHPVALGAGLPIFTGLATSRYLDLIESKAFPKGIVVHTYSNAS